MLPSFYCQFDTTSCHLGRGNLTWRIASIRLVCGHDSIWFWLIQKVLSTMCVSPYLGGSGRLSLSLKSRLSLSQGPCQQTTFPHSFCFISCLNSHSNFSNDAPWTSSVSQTNNFVPRISFGHGVYHSNSKQTRTNIKRKCFPCNEAWDWK